MKVKCLFLLMCLNLTTSALSASSSQTESKFQIILETEKPSEETLQFFEAYQSASTINLYELLHDQKGSVVLRPLLKKKNEKPRVLWFLPGLVIKKEERDVISTANNSVFGVELLCAFNVLLIHSVEKGETPLAYKEEGVFWTERPLSTDPLKKELFVFFVRGVNVPEISEADMICTSCEIFNITKSGFIYNFFEQYPQCSMMAKALRFYDSQKDFFSASSKLNET